MSYSVVANSTFSYLATMVAFRNSIKEKAHQSSYIKITTITMISSYKQDIDIQKLRGIFEERKVIKIKMKDSEFDGFEWSLKNTTFYNQITLSYTDQNSIKSVKVFPNGSIQVAGCSDLFDCNRIIKQLAFLFTSLLELPRIDNTFRVVMINSNFSVNYSLNLIAITQVFAKDPIFSVSFDPDRYSAVKLKFKPAQDMKQITTSIFSTGKIIITGAETLKEIVFAYHIINQYLYTFKDVVKVSEVATKDLFNEILGYTVPELDEYVRQHLKVKPWLFSCDNFKINF